MSILLINPQDVSQPIGPYSQGALVRESGSWLHIAGQIGAPVSGQAAATFTEQADLAWANVCHVLKDSGMEVTNLVKVVTYIVGTENIPAMGPVREKYLQGHCPAATLLIVPALARPEWLVEIAAVAFKSE